MKAAAWMLGFGLLAVPVRATATNRASWEGAYHNGTRAAVVGVGGASVMAGGLAVDHPPLATLGGLGVMVGLPAMAGGSLRAGHGLRELGKPVTQVPGYAAWGLYAGGIAVGVVNVFDPWTNLTIPFFALVGRAYLAATFRVLLDAAAWDEYGHRPARRRRLGALQVDLVPAPNGLALVGTW